ncbi:MAG: L-2-amino-thiazoline-4-carboxylic acid hydrolase [Oscillospiraceae bacterium]|nr:L-2-amino-thiazoline-4-carboxylic acid hydrolase [Oscillospiraceae bacterium]
MRELDKQFFFRGIKKTLREEFGDAQSKKMWEEACDEYDRILVEDPSLKEHKGTMAIPAVALFRVLSNRGVDAEELLNGYGRQMGVKFASIVHGITSIPGVSNYLWKNIWKIMDKMSSEELGYRRRIVSEPPEMYGVDILSCPYHEVCKELGSERAALCICSMDLEYMKGFHHIRYERESSVADGADCCRYRLRFDENKK